VKRFICGSPEYEVYMQEHAHARGEKDFLQSIAGTGMVAVDVGGHFGLAACVISRAVGRTGRLFCFEPVAEYRQALEDNVTANGLTNVEVVPAAVGKEAGTTHLCLDGGGTSIVPNRQRDRVPAKLVCLDEFFQQRRLGRLDLLNMDCEGSELLVLEGAQALLSRNHAKVFVEIHHGFLKALGHSVHDIVGLLEGLAYKVSTVSLSDLSLGDNWNQCEYLYARQ